MNVYDFDGTIYQGDSSVDFARYCLWHNKKSLKAVPTILKSSILYFRKKISTKQFKEEFFSFLNYIAEDELESLIKGFWTGHRQRIVEWYKNKPNDVIISASPEFLLEPIKRELGVDSVLATKMDRSTGIIEGENCKGREKVRRFEEKYNGQYIHEFYSDSLSDRYLAVKAEKAYYVKNGILVNWPNAETKEKSAVFNVLLNNQCIILYGIFGVLTTFINLISYYVCYNLMNILNVPSTVIAWILAIIFAFITNKLWVFDSKSFNDQTFKHEICTFLGVRIGTGLLEVGIMYFTVDVMLWNGSFWKLISSVIIIILNYVSSKFVIFTKK